MVEIGGKPILWHIMKHYSHYGFNEFVLALGYKGDVIRDYFINYQKFNQDFRLSLDSGDIQYLAKNPIEKWHITFAETGQESMTGYRVKLAGKYIDEPNFMLTYGDAVADVNIAQLVDFHYKRNTIGTVTGVYPPSRFGDMLFEGDNVMSFKQQQKDVNNRQPINGGYFVFKKEFLDLIPNDPSIDLERAPIDAIVNQKQLSLHNHKGFWQCMDTYRDYLQLNELWYHNPVWKLWD
jgi:glucose-1-phosphate cytidylyltransferase